MQCPRSAIPCLLLSFALSSFYVVRKYPTPIAVNDSLRRD